MRRSISFLDLLVVGLFAGFVSEAVIQFHGCPGYPEKPPARELPRFDPTMAPKEMSAKCRAEGKQLIAVQADGGFWGFDCVKVNLEKNR